MNGPRPLTCFAIAYGREHRVSGEHEGRETTVRAITADRLILAAGTIGSTNLLLRNRSAFPRLGRALGTRFCGNGDLLTVAVRATEEVAGKRVPRVIDRGHGPVITSAVRVDDAVDGGEGRGFSFWDSYRMLPGVQTLFAEIVWDALLLGTVFVLFFFAIRRAAVQTLSTLTSKIPGEPANAFGLGSSVEEIRRFLATDAHPPMHRDLPGNLIEIFVSGHTHVPSLSTLARNAGGFGDEAVIVNSGCWLRQMRPVAAHVGGPPVFISRFVQTHVRIFIDQGAVRVELREHPRPVKHHLLAAERLAILGRQPEQPEHGAEPRVIASRALPVAERCERHRECRGSHGARSQDDETRLREEEAA